MNVFIIPTWYPSQSAPLSGNSIKEQSELFARHYPDSNTGISVWGQREESYLLWIKDHVKNIKKIVRFFLYKRNQREVLPNLIEYYTPALTWTKRFFSGNIRGTIKANEKNFLAFQKKVGKVDVIHAHVSYPGGYIAMHLSKKYNIPYIITERMGPFPFPDFINEDGSLKKIILDPLQNANQVVAISWTLAQRIESFGIKNVKIISNFIDEKFFTPVSSKGKKPTFSLFFLGLLSKEKGLYDLLDAIELLKIENIYEQVIEFWIAGYGDVNPFIEYSKKLKIHKRIKIKWLGKLTREEVRDTMRKCDVFILPSHHESFGTVYIEAIACGKPIIATKNGGAEIILAGGNGFAVPVQNPKILSNVIILMVESYKTFEVSKIRKDFEENFSATVLTPIWMDLYKEVSSEK